MTDTLLKLIENHQNEKRSIQKKYFIESSINDTKINLIVKLRAVNIRHKENILFYFVWVDTYGLYFFHELYLKY